MANTTTTEVTEFIQAAMLKAQDDEIAEHLFWPAGGAAAQWLRTIDLTGEPGISASFHKYNAFSADDLVEGTDYTTTQALDPVAVTLTATEHGAQSIVTDLVWNAIQTPNGKEAYAADVARNQVKSIMSKFDVDILTLLQSLDSGVTNTGVDLTNAHVLECVDLCAKANMPKPWAGFLHPQQYSDLVNEAGSPFAQAAASGGKAEEFYGKYFIDVIYDVAWFVSTNVPTANAAADRGGGIISGEALGAVIAQMPVTQGQYNQSLRATEILTVMQYAVGEPDGTMGMYLVSDA